MVGWKKHPKLKLFQYLNSKSGIQTKQNKFVFSFALSAELTKVGQILNKKKHSKTILRKESAWLSKPLEMLAHWNIRLQILSRPMKGMSFCFIWDTRELVQWFRICWPAYLERFQVICQFGNISRRKQKAIRLVFYIFLTYTIMIF